MSSEAMIRYEFSAREKWGDEASKGGGRSKEDGIGKRLHHCL